MTYVVSKLNNIPTKYFSNIYNGDLAKIIPPIQYAYFNIKDTGNEPDSKLTGIISINSYNSSANYYVLTSYLSNYSGGSGTYNPANTVTALGVPVIYNKTESSFNYTINKTTGDNANIYGCFTIIYYS